MTFKSTFLPKISFFNMFNSNIFIENLIIIDNQFFDNGKFLYGINDNYYFYNLDLIHINIIDNLFYSDLFSLSGFGNINIDELVAKSNYFLSFFTINDTQNISFNNCSFIKNNNNITFLKNYEISENQPYGGLLMITTVENFLINYTAITDCYSNTNFTGIYMINVDKILIINSIFKGNIGNFTSSSNYIMYGVALLINNDDNQQDTQKIKIENSLFISNQYIIDNSSEGSPCGTIRFPTGSITLRSTVFESNRASSGSICLNLIVNHIVIINCRFNQNSPYMHDNILNDGLSGAITIDFYNLTIISSNFSLNEASVGTCFFVKDESSFESQNFFALNINFIKNYAEDSSNVLNIYADSINRSFIFKNSNFIKGQSNIYSGLFFFETKSGDFLETYSFFNCLFLGNIGRGDGAILDHYPSSPINCLLYFDSCQFIENTVIIQDIHSEGIVIDVWGEALDNEDNTKIAIQTKNCVFRGMPIIY